MPKQTIDPNSEDIRTKAESLFNYAFASAVKKFCGPDADIAQIKEEMEEWKEGCENSDEYIGIYLATYGILSEKFTEACSGQKSDTVQEDEEYWIANEALKLLSQLGDLDFYCTRAHNEIIQEYLDDPDAIIQRYLDRCQNKQ